MSKKKLVLVILGAVVALLIIAALVIDSRLGVLFPAPRAAMDSVVKPRTRVQLVVDPFLAQDFIGKLATKNSQAPPWAIPYVLPYKAALLIAPDPILNKQDLTLMINAQRLGSPICKHINSSPLNPPASQWFSKPMEAKTRGLLVREGEAPLSRDIAVRVKSLWKQTPDISPMEVSGKHAVELLVDLRDGTALTAIISLLQEFPQGQNLDPAAVFSTGGGMLTSLASVCVQADVDKEGTLVLHLELACTPATDDNMVGVIKMLTEMALGQAKDSFSRFGAELQGKMAADGKTVKGDFKVAKFGDLVQTLVASGAAAPAKR